MYSEQGLDALMRAVFLLVCQRLMVVSNCMPGSPHCQVASAMVCIRSRARYSLTGFLSLTVRVEKVRVGFDGAHELVGDADGVVRVLEEDGGVGLGVGPGAVIPSLNEMPSLLLFLHLALDEVLDIRMVDVEDDHLRGATSLAAGLDDAGKGVEAAHEAERAGCGAATARASPWIRGCCSGSSQRPSPT